MLMYLLAEGSQLPLRQRQLGYTCTWLLGFQICFLHHQHFRTKNWLQAHSSQLPPSQHTAICIHLMLSELGLPQLLLLRASTSKV